MILYSLHRAVRTGLFLVAAHILGALNAQAATYQFVSSPYSSITNYAAPCGGGTCVNFPAGGVVTGSFTTAAPLPANQALADILPLVTSWSFASAVAFDSSSAATRILRFQVATDASGNITQSNVQGMRWNTPPDAGPHAINDRTDLIQLITSGGASWLNGECSALATSPAGVADACASFFIDTNPTTSASQASYASGTWSTVPTVSINNVTLTELDSGTPSFTFTVQLSGVPASPVSLNWATSDGTATAGSDYTAASGTLTWAAGDGVPKTIVVYINGDTVVEPDETFFVTLSSIVGADPGTVTGTGTLLNEDIAPPGPPGATSIPTLSEWGLVALSALLALVALTSRRIE